MIVYPFCKLCELIRSDYDKPNKTGRCKTSAQ